MPENPAVADPCRTATDHHVPGYGHALLPFPAEPGPFLAEALKALYGVFLRFKCEVAGAELDVRGAESPPKLSGSLGYLIGGGTSDLPTRTIGAIVHPGELSVRSAAGTAIELDPARPGAGGRLTPLEPERVFNGFAVLTHGPNLLYFINEFAKDPAAIFKEYLRLFAPARQTLNVNVLVRRPGEPVLATRQPAELVCPRLTAFPGERARFDLARPVELVDARTPDGPALGLLRALPVTLDYRRDESSPVVIPAVGK
jgi:hypothetical protein